MSKLAKIAFRLAAASIIASVPGASLADPNLPNARPHQHVLTTPKGNVVDIGPDICGNPELQHAWNQFHYNTHISESAPGVPVETLGPQSGARGLHNDIGSDMAIERC